MSVSDIVKSGLSALMGGDPLFTVTVGGAPLRVVRFSGHEAISNPFEFRIEVAATELDPDSLLNQPVALTIKGLDEPRVVHGFVTEAEYVGNTRNLELYELSVAPWAHRLMHQFSSRIFQDKTTQEIVTEVLTKAGLEAKWFRFSLVEQYGPRNYCVQYRETDLAFISRLLEEDGVFYFFEHHADKHVWVMADHSNAHKAIPGTPAVLFNPPTGSSVQDREHVHSFRFGGRVRPGKVALRDFNLHKPEQPMEVKEIGKAHSELEVYDFPAEYQEPGHAGVHEGKSMAKIRLEELQATRRLGSGASDSPRLTPGYVMTLANHPRHDFDGEYRLLQVNHVGAQPQVLDQDASGASSYRNTFTATELKLPYRPPRTTQRPTVRGVQTATVVGPEGEEIHTDKHGRVRVQFHWDRDDKFDESSATWVRVSQMWAGNRYGAMFLPRIGHEVLVDFIEGDPDRPIITGRIYHGQNATPYPLPEEKTKSTIKSDSSLGGGGFNEFRFEDRKGAEEIFLHAQRDWNTVILRNMTESVGAKRVSTIGTSDTTLVGTYHKLTIRQPPPPPSPMGPPPPPIPPTGNSMSDKFFSVTTGLATVTMDGANVTIEAQGKISIHSVGEMSLKSDTHLQIAGKSVSVDATDTMSVSAGGGLSISGKPVTVSASGGSLVLSGGPDVEINGPGLFAGRVMDPAPAQILRGSSTVYIGGAQFPFDVQRLPNGDVQVGKAITVKGDESFQAKVLRDLSHVAKTPTGRAMLDSIDASGKTLTVVPTKGGNATGYDSPGDRFYNADGSPGSGTNATVEYNPDNGSIGNEPWETRPPAIGMAHEFVHADQAMHGTMSTGYTANDKRPDPLNPGAIAQEKTREVEAAGIPPNNTRSFDENKIRAEWDPPLPPREWY